MPRKDVNGFLTVVVLESHEALISLCTFDALGAIELKHVEHWDPSKCQTDTEGRRLLEEVIRQVRSAWGKHSWPACGVVLTLPGTLSGTDTIISSSRLGIRQSVPVAKLLSDGLGVQCKAFHDVECLAIGEDQRGASLPQPATENCALTFVYVFADEGVGSKTIIDGRTYLGAGVAGVLGRMTVQPDGSYFKALSARGPLEVFSSRPWVSENLVSMYLSEQNKQGASPEKLQNTTCRRAIRVAAAGDWRCLDYSHMADGIHNNDPLVTAVLDVAARYLGFAINAIITILHPHRLVLGGSMMTKLPGFPDQVIAYARRYSWANAWNTTDVRVSALGRQAQVYGAVELWSRHEGCRK